MKAAHQVLLCVEGTVYTAVFEEDGNIELHQINLVQCTRNDFSCAALLAVGIIGGCHHHGTAGHGLRRDDVTMMMIFSVLCFESSHHVAHP